MQVYLKISLNILYLTNKTAFSFMEFHIIWDGKSYYEV